MRTDTTPVFDHETMLDRLGGDEELLQDVVRLFLDESPAMIERVRRAVADADPHELERAAHSMKGAVLNLAADPVAELALQLERMGRDSRLERAGAVLDGLERCFERLLAELRGQLDARD